MRNWLVPAALLLCAAAPAGAEITKVGNWQVEVTKDPITDKQRAVAMAGDGRNVLAIKCDDPGPTSLYLHFISDAYLGPASVKPRPLVYRFDGEAPVTQSWLYEKRAALNIENGEVLSFIRSATASEKVAFQVTDDEGVPHQAVIPIHGAKAALDTVMKVCTGS